MLDEMAIARPPRIAMLVSSMGRGGAERVAAVLCNAWAAQGREVWLIPTYLGSRDLRFPLSPDVRLRFIGDLAEAPDHARSGISWKIRTLRHWLGRVRPDVVVSFLPNVSVLAIAATRGLRVPVVACERADPAGGVDMGWALHVSRFFLYPLANCVTAQTEQAARRLRLRLPLCRRIAVIPNPLPDRLVAQRPQGALADGKLIIAVGRLAPEKRFDYLLRAFHAAFEDSSEWKLEIWGEGPLRQSLGALVESLGLTDRAFICGPTDEPWKEMPRAQVFALTSSYEGFPNSMLEAMALGLATVSFDCNSGPRDLTDNGRVGVLVPTGDIAAFARELQALADDGERRRSLGEAGSEYVRRSYSEESVLARWDALFASVATKFTSRARDHVT